MNELNYLVVEGVPSSFVFKEKKLLNEKGSGEAKLFIGSKVNEDEFDRFFEFNQGYSYKFDKDNLLEYLNQTKLEYIYQSINQYKDVNISKWNELKELITNLRQSELKCSLKKFVDSSRYYVKSTDDIFKKTLRKLVFPKISDIYFEKNSSDHTVTIKVMVSEDRKNDVYNEQNELIFETNFKSDFPRNKIIFGAPGTGKSYKLNKDMEELLNNGGSYERVTFHPDYSYASFVGTYKPVPEKDDDGNDIITYKYVPGPFMRLYVKAMKSAQSDKPKPHLLIIEEINRASVAAVFGDIFQLLDRKNNISEYPIQTSEDMRYYLASELGDDPEFYNQIKLPDNMFLWATMNSADQGVFPMDTAFKRRWTFE